MKKILTRSISIIAIIIVAVTMTACDTFDAFKRAFIDERTHASEDTIYIGVYEPKTGDFQTQGLDEIKGIQLANSLYGHIKGRRVELVTVDNQSNIVAAESAIDDLIAMKPVVIIGSAGESLSMIASDHIESARIPTITPSATNPLITEDNPYYFRACITDIQRGAGLAEYATQELEAENIAMISIQDDNAATTLMDGFTRAVVNLEGDDSAIRLKYKIPVDDLKLDRMAEIIREAGSEVILMPVGTERADAMFTQIEEAGMTDIVFLGDTSWGSDEFVKMMEKHPAIRTAFPSDRVTDEDTTQNTVTAETQRFQIEYGYMYGESELPTESAALGYDSYLIAINAINMAEDLDPESVRDAMADLEGLRGTTGVFKFDEYGNPIKVVNIATIERGKMNTLYSTSKATMAGGMKKIDKTEDSDEDGTSETP